MSAEAEAQGASGTCHVRQYSANELAWLSPDILT